jgi:hypothetical protein
MPWSRGGRVQDPSVRLDAQDLAGRAGVACEVRRAEARGIDAVGSAQFEVTCAEGPGYLLIDGARPRGLDCLSLEAANRASDGRTPACRIAANRNAVPVVSALAAEAGIACRVDAGAMRGRTPADGILYEVGCAGEDGYWLERTAAGWTVTACLKVTVQGGGCRFTGRAEQAASVRRWLAGGAASDRHIVDQPGAPDLGRREDAGGAVQRRRRTAPGRRPGAWRHSRCVEPGLQQRRHRRRASTPPRPARPRRRLRPGLAPARRSAAAPSPVRLRSGRRCAKTGPGRGRPLGSVEPTISVGMSRSRAMRRTTINCCQSFSPNTATSAWT